MIDENKKQIGIVSISEALKIAQESGLDLVEMDSKAMPPVCRIMDYGKYQYRQSKGSKSKAPGQQGRAQSPKLKQVRIRLTTGQHDLQTKLKNINKFLKKGHKVRIEIQLRGREKAHQDLAREKLEEFVKNIEEKNKIEQAIRKSVRGLEILISHF